MAAHAWGWPLTRGNGRPHVGHTWGWPLTPGDGGIIPGDGRSHLGMAAYTWGWPLTRGDGGSPVGMAAHAMGRENFEKTRTYQTTTKVALAGGIRRD